MYSTIRMGKSLICPMFKKGNRKDPSNYRPLSLTSVCSKVMEHIIYSNIMSHIESNNILSDMQFGFQKWHSAELQLLQTIHDLAYNLNQKSQTDMILPDFSKAIDKVLHRHLLLKLNYYGVRGNILNWFTSFLTGHTIRRETLEGGKFGESSKISLLAK